MDDDLGEFAPDDWLSPEDVRRLTTDNTSLRARNEELQESLSASTSEVTRLQGVVHDNTSLRARNQELQESLSASTSEVTRLQGVIDNQEQVRASLDREMYNINLANQARAYESKLQAMQETNAQLEKEIQERQAEYAVRQKRLSDRNAALYAMVTRELRSTESLYKTCSSLRGEVSALKAANEELLLFRQAHSGPPRLMQRSSWRVRKAAALAHELFLQRRTRAPRLRGGSAVLKRGAQAAGTPRNSLGVVTALS
jgi:chromosome segregation ATPase